MKIGSRKICMILDLAMLALTASLMLCMFSRSPKMHVDVDRHIYPLKGIDVSAHNGTVDFRQAAADSVVFVMIKATEGTDFCDANFSANYAAAREAGLRVGAYHFFRFNSPGREQARHFIESVEGRHLDFPLAVDVEKWGNASSFSVDSVKFELGAMIDELRRSGYRVMLYTNRHGYDIFVRDDFADIPLWICSLSRPPAIEGWQLWQHSHQGRVRGLRTPVDLNTFNGDTAALMRFLHRCPASATPHTSSNDTINPQSSR